MNGYCTVVIVKWIGYDVDLYVFVEKLCIQGCVFADMKGIWTCGTVAAIDGSFSEHLMKSEIIGW